MKRTMFVGFMVAALVGLFCLPALYAANAPADLTIKAPEGMKATQPPVAFSHANHKQECKVCHHKDGDNPKACASAGCHDDTNDKKGDKSFYRAYHDMKSQKSCVGCHKAEKKGPTKCAECHKK